MRNIVPNCGFKSQGEQPQLCDTSGLSWQSRGVLCREGLGGGEVEVTHSVQGWGQGLGLGKPQWVGENQREAQPGRCLGESVGEEKGCKADGERESG